MPISPKILQLFVDNAAGGGGEPPPPPPPPNTTSDYSLKGNPSFARADLSAATKPWYDRARAVAIGHHGNDPNDILHNVENSTHKKEDSHKNPTYLIARRCGVEVDALLMALRFTGDLNFLDAAVRLVDACLEKAFVTTNEGVSFRTWGIRWTFTDNSGQTQEADSFERLDDILASGWLATALWALHLNKEFASPGGLNYTSTYNNLYNFLHTDFRNKWYSGGIYKGLDGNTITNQSLQTSTYAARTGEVPFVYRRFRHSAAASCRFHHYMARVYEAKGVEPTLVTDYDAFALASATRFRDNLGTASGIKVFTFGCEEENIDSKFVFAMPSHYMGYLWTAYTHIWLDGGLPTILTDTFMKDGTEYIHEFLMRPYSSLSGTRYSLNRYSNYTRSLDAYLAGADVAGDNNTENYELGLSNVDFGGTTKKLDPCSVYSQYDDNNDDLDVVSFHTNLYGLVGGLHWNESQTVNVDMHHIWHDRLGETESPRNHKVSIAAMCNIIYRETSKPGDGGAVGTMTMEADPAFDVATITGTARTWYDRIVAHRALQEAQVPGNYTLPTSGNATEHAYSGNLYSYARQVRDYLLNNLLLLRITKNVEFLDEVVRIWKIMEGEMKTNVQVWTDKGPNSGKECVASGYKGWDSNQNPCKDADDRKHSATLAQIAYACKLNEGVASKSGYNFAQVRADIEDYLFNHFEPKWRWADDLGPNTFPILPTQFTHSSWSLALYEYYCGKLTNNQARQDWAGTRIDTLLGDHVVVDTALGTNTGRVWPRAVYAEDPGNAYLHPTTYFGYVIIDMIHAYYEGYTQIVLPTVLEQTSHQITEIVWNEGATTADYLHGDMGGFDDDSPPGSSMGGYVSDFRTPRSRDHFLFKNYVLAGIADQSGRMDVMANDAWASESDPANPERQMIPSYFFWVNYSGRLT